MAGSSSSSGLGGMELSGAALSTWGIRIFALVVGLFAAVLGFWLIFNMFKSGFDEHRPQTWREINRKRNEDNGNDAGSGNSGPGAAIPPDPTIN